MAEFLSPSEMDVLREAVWHAVQRGDIPDDAREVLHGVYPKLGGLPISVSFKDSTDELHFHLVRAERHAQTALDLLYKPDGAKRSMWFSMALGRAQSILMSLYVRDLKTRR
jgi:hypothetical protein